MRLESVPNHDLLISFAVNGPAKLIGVDNGDLRSSEPFKGSSQTTYLGRALALVQSTGTPGTVTLSATAQAPHHRPKPRSRIYTAP